jgi:cyclohexanecarboxylate-CoA ligase
MTVIFETVLTREQIEFARRQGSWPNRLLNDDLQAAAATTPERMALTDSRGSYTYVELAAVVDEVALGLLELGVRPQDVVSVQLPNWNEFVVLTLALERVGAVINPIATIFRGREVGAILDLARPVGVVTAASFRGFDHVAMYEQLWEGRSLRFGVVVGGDGRGRWLGWEDLRQLGRRRIDVRPQLDWLRPDPNQVTELIFTSGTTGQPKGVLHTANTLGAAALSAIRGQRLGPDDVFHMASTFAHQTGFVYGVRLPIHCGAPAVFQDLWDAGGFVELVGRHGITFTMGATPYVVDLLRAVGSDVSALRSLRTFISAGAPIPEPVAEEMAGRLTTCRLAPGWGMTENNLVTSVFPEDPPEKVVSSDGRPFPGMEVLVRSGGRPAAPDEEGDLYARGPFTFVGYVQGRAFTEPSFDPEGWFATGDRARVDAQGFIRITGRTKDLIIRGGENVPVKEIEDLILRHPAVRQVALVAVPDQRLGERAVACVVLEQGASLDLEGLRAHLRQHQVTPQFWPERLEVMAEFPTTPSGKVQKFRLRELVGATT